MDTATDTEYSPTSLTGRRLVDYDGLSAYLAGTPVSTIRTWVYERTIPHIRMGQRTVWFDLDHVDAWIASHEVATSTKGA